LAKKRSAIRTRGTGPTGVHKSLTHQRAVDWSRFSLG